MALSSGKRLGPYEITGPIGAGGMGEVYRAIDRRLNRAVAIKVVAERHRERPDLHERFKTEMAAAHDTNFIWHLSVRPDSRRFAYIEGGSGAIEVTRLWTIAAEGGEGVPLTDGRTNVWSPTWSSDGTKVFYVSNRGGSMDLWQQALSDDGKPASEPVALSSGLGVVSAAFSADGSRLAYSRGGRVANVWRVPIRSDRPATWADATPLTSEHAFIEFLDISPDGTQLAVSSDRRGNQDLGCCP